MGESVWIERTPEGFGSGQHRKAQEMNCREEKADRQVGCTMSDTPRRSSKALEEVQYGEDRAESRKQ